MKHLFLSALLLVGVNASISHAQKKPAPPKPTVENLHYGDHARQVIDFWKANSEKPTPLVLYIHGGGWRGGDKAGIRKSVSLFLNQGISVAAINYRYVQQGQAMGVKPPVKAPLHDAARALQFIRSKAKEWNIDKKRIGATGGSAGGCSSLWLALHDDLADPKNEDPIAHESTRLYCAAVNGAQTSLDPKELLDWMPNYKYGAHAFGLRNIQELVEKREEVLKWIKEYSPLANISKDDPPLFLNYGGNKIAKKGDEPKDPTHSVLLGLLLKEKAKGTGVEVIVNYPAQRSKDYSGTYDFLIKRLKK